MGNSLSHLDDLLFRIHCLCLPKFVSNPKWWLRDKDVWRGGPSHVSRLLNMSNNASR